MNKVKFSESGKMKICANNTIIAHFNGKAIVINEYGNLFFVVMPEEFVTLGEVIESTGLTSVEVLEDSEVEAIKNYVSDWLN